MDYYRPPVVNCSKHIDASPFKPIHTLSSPTTPHPYLMLRATHRKSIFPYASYLPPPPPPPPPPPQQTIQPIPVFNDSFTRPMHAIFEQPSPLSPKICLPNSNTRPSIKHFNFTPKDVEAVLYGYFGEQNKKDSISHSLSGIMLNKNREVTESNNNEHFKDLPLNLAMKEIYVGPISHKGVFATEHIKRGTCFGPYKGRLKTLAIMTSSDLEHSWEIFDNSQIRHFVCPTQYEQCWMKFVNCARYHKEQNLCLVQNNGQIFYKAIADIETGHELLVWYGENHVQYMGFPLALNTNNKELIISPTVLSEEQRRKMNRETINLTDAKAGSFPCNRCGKIFSYEYYREKHLKYTRCVDKGDRKFPCHLCQRSFEKKDRLRIHILHVHQKYRPHVCKTCGKRFSQSSSLNKHSRVHTGERPYACPHCPKSFTASSILRTHLRQHNGERPFKCKFCGKAFASHAAHDSHVRRTHEKLKIFSCNICAKTFSMEFELKFHLTTHTHQELAISNGAQQRQRTYSEESDNSLVIDIENEDI